MAINNIVLSLMLAHMFWAHCSGQSDYSKIPVKEQKYMEYVRNMLQGQAKLFLERGVNGIIEKNQRICWTSRFIRPGSPGYHHTLKFFDRAKPSKERKQTKGTDWYVGLKDGIPSVLVNAHDPKVNGDYTLYFARPTCFLMGNETAQAPSSGNVSSEVYADRATCQLWVRKRVDWEDKEECMAAFFRECSTISGVYYRYRKGVCNSVHVNEK
uniref:Lipocalin n=1 Tax=Rhipicephalus zambeziensis TaxID=60191 RepID=A0A224Y818_9ACAR